MASFADAVAALDRIAAAVPAAAEAAANGMADAFRDEVRRVLLERGHAFSTQTPSAPGTPPAFISGHLAASMSVTPAVPEGLAVFRSSSGPGTRYAAIQEFGGEMRAHTPKGMRWQQPPGTWHRSMAHSLPERSYMRSTTDRMVADGSLRDAGLVPFAAVIDAAIGG